LQDAVEELETEKLAKAGGTVTGQILFGNTATLVFEGSSTDAFQTTLGVVNPTTADKTILLPNTSGTLITTNDSGTVSSAMIADGAILNADINASAAIALTKLENVTAAQIIVGNGSNVPTAVAVTGDISINNAGLTAIASGVIVDGDISGSAAITGSKIATGTTSAVGVLQLTDSATSTSATTAATPAAVKTAKDAADAAASTANAALPKAGGTMTGNLIIDNAKEIRFSEADGDGANYTGLKAQAQSADIVLTLPAVAPTTGQVLKSSSTATTLEWATDSATDSTKLPLTGGTLTGNLILNAQSDVRFADADSSHYIALQSPGTIASSFTLTLPATDAAVSGYVLASDASGTLSWVDPGSSSSPTFTGDATLTNDGALVGFSNLNATYTGNSKTLTVTVATKTGAHRYNGTGSSSGYKIGGKEAPFLTLTPGRTYVFDQADNSNSGHPLRFYLEADKTTAYTTGVTTNGTAGSAGAYTQIVVSDTTPQILHYQCSSHASMGNSVQTNSNIASTAKTLATARTIGGVSFDGSANINLAGVNAAGNQDTSGTAAVATAITIADESSDTTCFPLFATAATGDLGAKSGSNLTFNSSSGALTATSFVGALTGNASGSAATVTGAAQSAITSLGTLTGLAIATGSSGTSSSAGYNELVIEGGDEDIGINFLSPAANTRNQQICFGDSNNNKAGRLVYDHSVDTLRIFAGNTERFQANSTGATVTGTLVADGLTVDTNTLHVDATNNRVGIGVVSPATELHVQDSSGDCLVRVTSADGSGAFLDLGDASDPDGGRIVYDTGSNLVFCTASNERLRLDNSGRCIVGGGTHGGGSALVVKGGNQNTYSTAGFFSNHTNPTSGTDLAQLRFGSNATGVGATIDFVADADWGTNDFPTKILFKTCPNGSNSRATALTLDSSQNATFAGTVSDGKGKTLRQIPASGKSSQYTLTASDSGTVVYNSSGGWIIPNNTLDEGDTVSLLNNSGSDQTITASALGTALYNTADGVNIKASTITLGARAMATVYFISPTIAFIQASALTVS
jgi:hypothetical protein